MHYNTTTDNSSTERLDNQNTPPLGAFLLTYSLLKMGMKNHDLVPVELITSIAKLRHGGTHKILSTLLTFKLIAHDRSVYDGALVPFKSRRGAAKLTSYWEKLCPTITVDTTTPANRSQRFPLSEL